MTSIPTPENVHDLSREELIEVVLQQAEIIRQLHAEVEQLKNRRRRRATRRSHHRGIGNGTGLAGNAARNAGRNPATRKPNAR